jgi:hypothetical protein
LDPTVNVINAFSATIGGGVSLAYPPAGVVFTGIGVLLSDVNASRGPLLDLFARIENIFRRLETYIEGTPTAGMTDTIVGVMVEVLCVLAIATKEVKQSRAKMFLKKLVGRRDMENALRRLENMTTEETRMTSAEALKAIHGVEGVLQGVTDLLHGVHDKVNDIGDKVIDGNEKTRQQTENAVSERAVDVEEVRNANIWSKTTASDGSDSTSQRLRQFTCIYAIFTANSRNFFFLSQFVQRQELGSWLQFGCIRYIPYIVYAQPRFRHSGRSISLCT